MKHANKTLVVLLTLAPVACGEWADPNIAYETHGISVYHSVTEQAPREAELARQTELVVAALAEIYVRDTDDLWDALRGLTVFTYDRRLPYKDTGASSLYQSERHAIHLHYVNDLSRSAYMHELGHALGWELVGSVKDPGHKAKKTWGTIALLYAQERRS